MDGRSRVVHSIYQSSMNTAIPIKLIEEIDSIEVFFRGMLKEFQVYGHHLECVFNQFKPYNDVFVPLTVESCSCDYVNRITQNSSMFCKILQEIILPSRTITDTKWIKALCTFFEQEVIPLYQQYINFWEWKLQALELWNNTNSQFMTARDKFLSVISHTRLHSEDIVSLGNEMRAFLISGQQESCNEDSLVQPQYDILTNIYSLPLLRAHVLEAFLHKLFEELPSSSRFVSNIAEIQLKYQNTVVLQLEEIDAQRKILLHATSSFPIHKGNKLRKPYRVLLSLDTATIHSKQAQVILCNDVFITTSSKKSKSSKKVNIYPVELTMRAIINPSNPKGVLILSEMDWKLHSFKFETNDIAKSWILAFEVAKNYVGKRSTIFSPSKAQLLKSSKSSSQLLKYEKKITSFQLYNFSKYNQPQSCVNILHYKDEIKEQNTSTVNFSETKKEPPTPPKRIKKPIASPARSDAAVYNTTLVSSAPNPPIRPPRKDIVPIENIHNHWVFQNDYNSINNFEELLNHPPGVNYMYKFLKRNYCEENLSFLQAVDKFKKDDSANIQKANELYKKYISEDSLEQINLDYSTVLEIKQKLNNYSTNNLPVKSYFDSAYSQIKGLLFSDSFMKFVQSDEFQQYKSYLEELGKNDKKSKRNRFADAIGAMGTRLSKFKNEVSSDTISREKRQIPFDEDIKEDFKEEISEDTLEDTVEIIKPDSSTLRRYSKKPLPIPPPQSAKPKLDVLRISSETPQDDIVLLENRPPKADLRRSSSCYEFNPNHSPRSNNVIERLSKEL